MLVLIWYYFFSLTFSNNYVLVYFEGGVNWEGRGVNPLIVHMQTTLLVFTTVTRTEHWEQREESLGVRERKGIINKLNDWL